jgi:uridine phosphorylase
MAEYGMSSATKYSISFVNILRIFSTLSPYASSEKNLDLNIISSTGIGSSSVSVAILTLSLIRNESAAMIRATNSSM